MKNKTVLLEGELQRAQVRIQQLQKQSANNSPMSPQSAVSPGNEDLTHDQLQDKIGKLEQELDEQDLKHKQLQERLRNLETGVEGQERRVNQMESEATQLRNRYQEAKRGYEQVKAELDATMKQFEEFA